MIQLRNICLMLVITLMACGIIGPYIAEEVRIFSNLDLILNISRGINTP